MTETLANEDRKKIVIADDEQDLREALFTALAGAGYEVFPADNGKDALALALEHKPDLIMLDLVMPEMTGQEVLEELKKDEWGKDAKILILTALSDLESLSQILAQGGHDYLVKSDWELGEIVRKVSEKLAQ
jgi:CheY-like chemotaxis protein